MRVSWQKPPGKRSQSFSRQTRSGIVWAMLHAGVTLRCDANGLKGKPWINVHPTWKPRPLPDGLVTEISARWGVGGAWPCLLTYLELSKRQMKHYCLKCIFAQHEFTFAVNQRVRISISLIQREVWFKRVNGQGCQSRGDTKLAPCWHWADFFFLAEGGKGAFLACQGFIWRKRGTTSEWLLSCRYYDKTRLVKGAWSATKSHARTEI